MTAEPLPAPQDAVVRRSRGDQAAIYIRRLIFDGRLRPGSHVPQEEIARTLGISRIPVREALIALESEGWVTIEMHRGAFINALDEQSVRDHYELFGLVYGFAAERATVRHVPELAGQLDGLARAMVASDDPDDVSRLTNEFHDTVVDAARSPRVKALLRGMTGIIPGNFFELVSGAIAVEREGAAAIARAVERGDAEQAAAEYRRTMARQGDNVVEVFTARGLFEAPTT